MLAGYVHSHAVAGNMSKPVHMQCSRSRRALSKYVQLQAPSAYRHMEQGHTANTPELPSAANLASHIEDSDGTSSSIFETPTAASVVQPGGIISAHGHCSNGTSNGMQLPVGNHQHSNQPPQQQTQEQQGQQQLLEQSQASEVFKNRGLQFQAHGGREPLKRARRAWQGKAWQGKARGDDRSFQEHATDATLRWNARPTVTRGRGGGRQTVSGRGAWQGRTSSTSHTSSQQQALGGPVCCSVTYASIEAMKPAGAAVVQHMVLAQSLLDTWWEKSAVAGHKAVAHAQEARASPADGGSSIARAKQSPLQTMHLVTTDAQQMYDALCTLSVLQLLLQQRFPGHTLVCMPQAHSSVHSSGPEAAFLRQKQHPADKHTSGRQGSTLEVSADRNQSVTWYLHCVTALPKGAVYEPPAVRLRVSPRDDVSSLVMWMENAMVRHAHMRMTVNNQNAAQSAVTAFLQVAHKLQAAGHCIGFRSQQWAKYPSPQTQKSGSEHPQPVYQMDVMLCKATSETVSLLSPTKLRLPLPMRPSHQPRPWTNSQHPGAMPEEAVAAHGLGTWRGARHAGVQRSTLGGLGNSAGQLHKGGAVAATGSQRSVGRQTTRPPRRPSFASGSLRDLVSDVFEDHFPTCFTARAKTVAEASAAAVAVQEQEQELHEAGVTLTGRGERSYRQGHTHDNSKPPGQGPSDLHPSNAARHADMSSAQHTEQAQQSEPNIQHIQRGSVQDTDAVEGTQADAVGEWEVETFAEFPERDVQQEMQSPLRLVVNTFEHSTKVLASKVLKATHHKNSCVLLACGSQQLANVNKMLVATSIQLLHTRFELEKQRRDRAKQLRRQEAQKARQQEQLLAQQWLSQQWLSQQSQAALQGTSIEATRTEPLKPEGHTGGADDGHQARGSQVTVSERPVVTVAETATVTSPSTAAVLPVGTVVQNVPSADIASQGQDSVPEFSGTNPSLVATQNSDIKLQDASVSTSASSASGSSEGSIVKAAASPAHVVQVRALPVAGSSTLPALAPPPVRPPVSRPTAPAASPPATQQPQIQGLAASPPATQQSQIQGLAATAPATQQSQIQGLAATPPGTQQPQIQGLEAQASAGSVAPQTAPATPPVAGGMQETAAMSAGKQPTAQPAAAGAAAQALPQDGLQHTIAKAQSTPPAPDQDLPPMGHALLFKVRHYPDEEDSEHFDQFPSYQGLAVHCVQLPSSTVHQYLQHTETPYPLRSCSNYIKVLEPPRQHLPGASEQAGMPDRAQFIAARRKRSSRSPESAAAAGGAAPLDLPELEGLESLGGVEVVGLSSTAQRAFEDEDHEDALWEPTKEQDDESDPEFASQVQNVLWQLAHFGVVYMTAVGQGARLRVLNVLSVMNDVLGLRGGLEAVAMVVDNSNDKINSLAKLKLQRPNGTVSIALYTIILAADLSQHQLIDPRRIPVPHQPILQTTTDDDS